LLLHRRPKRAEFDLEELKMAKKKLKKGKKIAATKPLSSMNLKDFR